MWQPTAYLFIPINHGRRTPHNCDLVPHNHTTTQLHADVQTSGLLFASPLNATLAAFQLANDTGALLGAGTAFSHVTWHSCVQLCLCSFAVTIHGAQTATAVLICAHA